jgi:hypothetical protein
VFPNQLLSALIRGNRLFLPNIGAQPEPPEVFNVNVQSLVSVADTDALAEEFCNSGLKKLTLLQSLTTTLTGGNILLNRDGGTPAAVGSVLTFLAIEGFADRVLEPNECVTVTYKVGLASPAQFDFFVDVLGDIVAPAAPAIAAPLASAAKAAVQTPANNARGKETGRSQGSIKLVHAGS